MLNSYLVFKIATSAAKEMVTSELSKRVASSMVNVGGRFLIATAKAGASLVSSNQKGFSTPGNELIQEEPNSQRASGSAEGKNNRPESMEYLVKNWLEDLFAKFQMIILWHEPHVSLAAIVGILTSFMMVTFFAPRFYATIMVALFIHNLTKVWFRHIWPEIRVPPGEARIVEDKLDLDRFTHLHPQLMTLDEFFSHLNSLWNSCDHIRQKLLNLRSQKPVLFCTLVCSILACTATIGNLVSGLTLIFATLTALTILPGLYLYLVPTELKAYLTGQLSIFFKLILHFEDVAMLSEDNEQDDQNEENRKNEKNIDGKFELNPITKSNDNQTSISDDITASSASSAKSSILTQFTSFFYSNKPEEISSQMSAKDRNPLEAASEIRYPNLIDISSHCELKPLIEIQEEDESEEDGEKIVKDEEDSEGFVIL